MNNIFDTHAHYNDDAYNDDRDEILKNLPSKGVTGVMNCGTDLLSSAAAVKTANEYDYVLSSVGVYPHNTVEIRKGDMELIEKMLSDEPKCKACGEIGLDYYYDDAPKELQKEYFERFLDMANNCHKPVLVHDREAHEDVIKLLKTYKPDGIIHCYSGSLEMLREIMDLGMYIGIGGAVTFKNARKSPEAAKAVPIERLVLETDAPYMSPVPHRGERCTSDMIEFTAKFIAELRSIDVDELLKATEKNAKELFKI